MAGKKGKLKVRSVSKFTLIVYCRTTDGFLAETKYVLGVINASSLCKFKRRNTTLILLKLLSLIQEILLR